LPREVLAQGSRIGNDDDDDVLRSEHPQRHHSHWRNDGLPSRWVAYYDAASLYPSSGKQQQQQQQQHVSPTLTTVARLAV